MAKTINIYDQDAEDIDNMIDGSDEMSWGAKIRELKVRAQE